jgi:hypothetical protein
MTLPSQVTGLLLASCAWFAAMMTIPMAISIPDRTSLAIAAPPEIGAENQP